MNLSTESIEGSSLAFERVHDVKSGNSLSASVLGVGDGVTDYVLEENLEHTPRFFVDETGDTLDTTSASETANGWFGDALDVVAQDLAMTLGAALAQAFASFAATRHDEYDEMKSEKMGCVKKAM